MSEWIALATGPSAERYYDIAKNDSPGASVITCNAGLKIEKNPDLYWVSDRGAVKKYKQEYKRFHNNGGKIVSAHKHRSNLNLDHEVFDYSSKMDDDSYHGRTSGIIQVRYLMEEVGADIIRLVGYDGYCYEKNKQRRGINSSIKNAISNIFDDDSVKIIRYGPTGRLI